MQGRNARQTKIWGGGGLNNKQTTRWWHSSSMDQSEEEIQTKYSADANQVENIIHVKQTTELEKWPRFENIQGRGDEKKVKDINHTIS